MTSTLSDEFTPTINIQRSSQGLIVLVLVIIVLLGIVLRVAHYSQSDDSVGWGRQVLDYASMAQNVSRGNGYVITLPEGLSGATDPSLINSWQEFAAFPQGQPDRPNAYALPGYPYLVATVWTLSTVESFTSVQSFQAVVDATAGCLALFAMLVSSGRPRAGLIGALGYAIAPPLIIQSALFLPDALASPLNLSALAAVVLGFAFRRPYLGAVLAGLILGLGNWFRGDSIFLLPLLPIAVAVVPSITWPTKLGWTGVFVGVWLVPTLALGLFYRDVYGEFHLTRPGVGNSIYQAIGQQENPWGIVPSRRGNLDRASVDHLNANGYTWGTWDGDAFLVRETISYMTERPGWFMEPTMRRFLRVVSLQKPPEGPTTLPDAVVSATRIVGPLLPLLGILGVVLLRGSPLLRNVLLAAWLSRVLPFSFLRDEFRLEILLVGVYIALLAVVVDAALTWARELRTRRQVQS